VLFAVSLRAQLELEAGKRRRYKYPSSEKFDANNGGKGSYERQHLRLSVSSDFRQCACVLPGSGSGTAAGQSPYGQLWLGLALTGGNTDTKSFNLSYELTHDPKTRNKIKTNGLWILRSKSGSGVKAVMFIMCGRLSRAVRLLL
jgi:hypothetical protein